MPVARAAAAVLLLFACVVGHVLLRWAQGVPPAAELRAHAGIYTYMLAVSSAVVGWFGYSLGRVEQHLRRTNEQLARLASTDELTGLANVRAFHQELPRLLSLARRLGVPLSLVILDLDHFKRINDRFGHAAGDAALRCASAALRVGRRREDLVARVGGEEVAIVLPGVDTAGARTAAERALAALREVRLSQYPAVRLAASAGIATLRPDDSHDSLVARADAALYAAKGQGRDRVEVAPGSSAPAPTPAARTPGT